MIENVIWLKDVGMSDVDKVGGKNASLGEMISGLESQGVRVPGGFATTAEAFESFLEHSDLKNKINKLLSDLDITDISALTKTGLLIRQWVEEAPFPDELHQSIVKSYGELTRQLGTEVTFAVRSSATAEDLPEASFAGQQETYLNVSGIEDILTAVRKVFASLYNDRAISYRVHQGFEHDMVSLSAGIQQMVRSDIGSSGVMFTLDTESGFDDVVFITSAYGLGETVVQGSVNPDEFYVHKSTLASGKPAILSRNLGSKSIKMIYADDNAKSPVTTTEVGSKDRMKFSLSDSQIEELAHFAMKIESHYGRAMDIEWALDGLDGKIYIVQARPETVKSRQSSQNIERYKLLETSKIIVEGRAIGQKIGSGKTKIINDLSEMGSVNKGDILVTDMTDPD